MFLLYFCLFDLGLLLLLPLVVMVSLGLPSIIFFDQVEFVVCLEHFGELEFDCTDFDIFGYNCISFYSFTDFFLALELLFYSGCSYLVCFYVPPAGNYNNWAQMGWDL
jgi:hypothetical protein